jgi:plasmid replication initiation protein
MTTEKNKSIQAYVVQSNRLIEARYAMTIGEARLLLAMIAKIKPSDQTFTEYTLALPELARMFSIDQSNIYDEIKKITKRLMGRVLQIQQSDGSILLCHWVCRAVCRKGTVSLSFVPDLMPYLLLLKKEFTVYEIEAVKNFSSTYSLRIYQLLKQYAGIGYREISLKELKEMLGLKQTQYAQWFNFKARIIDQAKKELEDPENNCDISFKLETIKEGKKIARLKFFIQQRKRAEEEKKPTQEKQAQPAAAPVRAARINRIPFEHDEAFGFWLAQKGLAVDLFQWAESGQNSLICKASYNDFLRETAGGK